MTSPTSFTFLQEIAESLSTLASSLNVEPDSLRAQDIRRAEKHLTHAESFFTNSLGESIKKGRQSEKALAILRERLKASEGKESEISECNNILKELRRSMERWLELDSKDRTHLVTEARNAEAYLNNRTYIVEAPIINRYERFKALKDLLPYADNAEHICEAIAHYENRHTYETNLQRLEQKREEQTQRLQSETRGFYLAMSLSILLVTIPLCIPFAWSLWSRRRETQLKLANIDESIRRNERRIVAADEGIVASEAIREILGDLSTEQIRRTLMEVRELRMEFQSAERPTTLTARLIAFLEDRRTMLARLFEDRPADTIESLRWLVEQVTKATNIESEVQKILEHHENLSAQKRALVKGYSVDILRSSIATLEETQHASTPIKLDPDIQDSFFELCENAPWILTQIRESLWHTAHGHRIDRFYWKTLVIKARSCANTFAVCLLNMQFDDSFRHNKDANQCYDQSVNL